MKVEKISENKVKIILTLEELEKREISLNELENNASLARDLFVNLIEENNLDEEFKFSDSQLLIEANSDCENLFEITITKIDMNINNSNIDMYNESKNSSKRRSNYKAYSNIFIFNSMDIVLDLCSKIKTQNLFLGRNSLYKLDTNYILIFSKSAIKNKRFTKTFSFISEYSSNYLYEPLFETSIKEKAQIIIKNNAIQKLISI